MTSVTVQRAETTVSESRELHVDEPDPDAPTEYLYRTFAQRLHMCTGGQVWVRCTSRGELAT